MPKLFPPPPVSGSAPPSWDVLLLEDEPVLREEIQDFLNGLGYATLAVATVEAFHRSFDPHRHRLAVIDLSLPDGNGLDLIRQLRGQGSHLGIVVFSARNTSADRITGLAGGADHYLGKGCDLDELAVTLAALVRRLQAPPSARQTSGSPLQTHIWRLQRGPQLLLPPTGRPVSLSHQDWLVLHCLMRSPDTCITRRDIVHALGADFLDYDQRRLDTQMRRLRRRVEEVSGQTLPIKTLRNSGYCFYQQARIED